MLVLQDWRWQEVDGGSRLASFQCTQTACTVGMGPRSFWSDLWLLRGQVCCGLAGQ